MARGRLDEVFRHAFPFAFHWNVAGDIDMSLTAAGTIAIPNARGSAFDHGAFEPGTRRVFIAHTAQNTLEVVDVDTSLHVATLRGFPEAAGVVAGNGSVLVTNRGSAGLAWVDARTLETRTVLSTGPRPNGAAIVPSLQAAVVACIGDDAHAPRLQVLGLEGDRRWSVDLPGRPRWCVVDAKEQRVFLAIRNPSMVLVATLPELKAIQHWPLPADGAHGMDINYVANLLYVTCDGRMLVEVDTESGQVRRQWPLAGGPDATFFNPASGLVHVAIEDPGLIQTVDPRTNTSTQFITARGAKTTALVEPDRLYVFSALHGGVLDLAGA
jgi:DNA-binding beta-propeller fold protein YncE